MKPLLRALVRFALEIFFGELEVLHAERLPRQGPLVFCPNHPSAAMDGLLLGAVFGHRIHYLAKATLFTNRWLAALLRYIGAVPIHRRQDSQGGSRPADRNQQTFAAAKRHLADGGWLAIFPEGVSAPEQRLMPLRTGAARIALEAEAEADFNLGVRIVPIGLAYSAPTLFRSSVVVAVGEPLPVGQYREQYRADPFAAARTLTDAIDDGLRRELAYVPQDTLASLAAGIEEIYASEGLVGGPAAERLAARDLIKKAILHYAEHDPGRVASACASIAGYRRKLQQLRLSDRLVASSSDDDLPRRGLLLLELAVLAPIAAYGWINHLVAYNGPRLAVRWLDPSPPDVSSIKLASGIITFAASYLAQGYAAFRLLPPFWAALYLLSLPASGLLALRFASRLEEARDRMAILRGMAGRSRQRILARLARERETLLQELEDARQALGEPAQPVSPSDPVPPG